MDKSVFKLNALILRPVGLYRLDPEWPISKKIGYYIGKSIWMICLCGGIIFNLQAIIWGDGDKSIGNIAINIFNMEVFGSVLLRGYYFVINDIKTIDKLTGRFEEIYAHSTKFAFKPVTMDFIRLIDRILTIGWTVFVIVTGCFIAFTPVLKTPKELPFKIYHYYDLDVTLNYTFTLFTEWIAIEMMLYTHGTMDMLHSSWMLLTAEQVVILASDFANVVHDALKKCQLTEDEILEYLSQENNKLQGSDKIELILKSDTYKRHLSENLLYCVKRHQKLLEFIDEYQQYISPYMLVEVNFNFNYLIFVMFIFITVDNNSMYVPMSLYVSGITAQVFLLMFLGDRLSSKVDEMKESFYGVPWYLCNIDFLQNFKIIQLRMCKPVNVSAGKLISMNLDTFLEFMKKAFTFFTVLRQMNNN